MMIEIFWTIFVAYVFYLIGANIQGRQDEIEVMKDCLDSGVSPKICKYLVRRKQKPL